MQANVCVTARVFTAIQNVDIQELSICSHKEIRPILPCLVRMSLISPLDITKECVEERKQVLTILSGIESVNSIIALLSIDFHALETDVRKEQQLRQKLGSLQRDSVLAQSLQSGLALEFERSESTRRIRLVLSELLYIASQVQELQKNQEFQIKQSDLFDNAVYMEEISYVICIALAELPTLLSVLDIAETLLHVKHGPEIICWIVANIPDSFFEVCTHLIANGERQEESTLGRIRTTALTMLCQMNPSQALTVRAKCVELCRMPALAITLSLEHKNINNALSESDVVAFVSGLLLGSDQQVRTWIAMFIRNGQKRKWESHTALQSLREELLKRLQASTSQNAGQLAESQVVQASALLRLYCALRGIGGIKFQDDEVAMIVQLLTSHPPPSPAGVRFVSLGLCMLIACSSLIGHHSLEKRSIEWVQWLVREEAYFESTSGVTASFGEMLLLMAIHFHSNQLSAICELVCATLGMKIPIRPNNLTRMKQIFMQEIFTEQVVTSHAVKVPVTANLNANIPGFLPVHCIHQLLKSRAFAKHRVPIKNWIYKQICNSVPPLHPVLPALVEVYVNSILVTNNKTSEHTNKPITEDEIRRVFQNNVFGGNFNCKKTINIPQCETETTDFDIPKPSLTSQLLLLYYLLLYEDVRLSNMHTFISQDRKVKSYSNEFLSELPIKYLLQLVQRDQMNYAGLFSPLLRLLATHFPHLSLVDDWLDNEVINVDSTVINYEDIKISNIMIIETFTHVQTCPSRTGRLLRQLMSMKPTDIWPHAEVIIYYFKTTLSSRVPRYIQELYKQVWLRLNTVLPRCLWVLSINALLIENSLVKNVFLTQENIVLDPLQVLRCDTRVFRCAPILSVILRILQAALAASRSQLSRHIQDKPLTEKVGQLSSETEREDLRIALVAGQESAAVQILLEACLETEEDKKTPGQMWSLREIQSIICSYLHQVFIADPSLAKLVHFQGYPRELLPITVTGIPSMHICLDWIPELLSQPEPEKQIFAVDLASHLAIQYVLPKALSVSRLAINTLITLLGVLSAKDRVILFMPVLPALTRICLAFPPLAEDTTGLLLQLGRVNSAQAALGDKSADMLCQKVTETFCTLLQKAILQSQMSHEVKISLKEARESFKQNEYSDVITKCKKILKSDQDNYGALILLAAAMKEIEKHRSQVPFVLQKATKIQPKNPLAWQGLVVYYEKYCENDEHSDKLGLAYCKLLQMESDFSKFSCILEKMSSFSSQLKNNAILIEIIQNLNESRQILDNERVKLIDETLVQMLADNFHNLDEHRDFLKEIFISIVSNADAMIRHEYRRKYLKALYNENELETLTEECTSLHRQYPEDTLPLEYLCRIYYERNTFGGNYTDIVVIEFYETLTKINPGSEVAAIAKATYLKKTDNLFAARELLKDVLIVKPRSLYAWILLSEISLRLYCWEDAENAIRQAFKCREHKEKRIFDQMELMLIEAMSKSNSKQKWQTALELCENHLKRQRSTRLELIRARIGILLDNSSTYSELHNLESQPEAKVEASILRAMYLKQHDQLQEAANVLESALETSEAWLVLGVIYWQMTEYSYSLMAFLNGIKTDRYNWECLVYLGQYYREHDNDLERSRRCYQTALQINPNSEEAGIGLSTVYRLLKNQDANIQLLQKLTVKDGGPKWAWLQLGLQYLDHGDALQAIKAFQCVIRAHPNDYHTWESLADAYFARGAYTSALKSYQRASELCPTSLYSTIQSANIKLVIKQYKEAKRDFEYILSKDPTCLPALKGLAEVCVVIARENVGKQFLGRANESFQQAVDCLTLAVTQRKDMSCFWKLFGDACYRTALLPEKYSRLTVSSVLLKGHNAEDATVSIKRKDIFLLSVRCYCCALSLSPQSALLWHDLASCYLMQLHLDPSVDHKTLASKCLAAGKHAAKLNSSLWSHWNLLGVICMSPYIKNYALAQHAYIMAIDKDFNNAIVWSNMGTLYLYLGNLYKANEAYSQAQRADPEYVNTWTGQAIVAETMCRKEAVDLFRHSTQLGYHGEATLGYAHWVLTVLLQINRFQKDSLYTYIIENMHAIYVASDVLNHYVEHHPNDYYARNAYGLLLERQKLYKSAAEQFAAALSLCVEEEKDSVCINLARVLIQLQKHDEATKLCLAVKRTNYNSQCHLALSLFKAGHYEDSYTAYETALRLYANTETEKAYTLCAMAAIAYIFQGVDDAKTLLFQCIQIHPPVIIALLAAAALGILHEDLNLATLVLNELNPYENHSEYGPHIANLFACLRVKENNINGAVATLSNAVFKHPGDIRYLIRLHRILFEVDTKAFSKIAQKVLLLSKGSSNTDVVHLGCASALIVQSSDSEYMRSIQKLLFTYPDHVESWILFVAAFLPRFIGRDSSNGSRWISIFASIAQNYRCTASTAKWLRDSKEKLIRFMSVEKIE